jgi:hypothetical protein
MCILYWTISVAASDNLGGRLTWDTDLETLIEDLLEDQYSDPVRIVAFNTAEGWSRDVSEEVAQILSQRCGDLGNPGSGTRYYLSSANWNKVAPTLLFQSTAGRVTSPAQVAQVVLRARWWQLPSRS